MTFKEKLAQEHPECISEIYDGDCKGCPFDYGYETKDEHRDACKKHKCTECWNREMPETPAPMTAEEVWDIAKQLNHMSLYEMVACFGSDAPDVDNAILDVFDDFTPQEAKARIEEWESQRIHVGDVCKAFETSCVVTQVDENKKLHVVLLDDGSTDQIPFDSPLKLLKTGKNIDIQSVLEQISKE